MSGFPWQRYLLGDIDAQTKLLPSTDVEAQAVVVWCGVEVDDPLEGASWAGVRGCPSALLHHHTPVYQVHPGRFSGQSGSNIFVINFNINRDNSLSPGSLFLGVADAGDFANTSHHHPQPVVACQDLHSAAHRDALQADTIHLHQFITYTQARFLCEQTHRSVKIHTHKNCKHQLLQ